MDDLLRMPPDLIEGQQQDLRKGHSFLFALRASTPNTMLYSTTNEALSSWYKWINQLRITTQKVEPVVEASVQGVAQSLQQSPGASRAAGDGTDDRVFGSAMQADARRADWPALSNLKAPADGVAQTQPPEPPSGVVSGTAAIDPRFASMDARRALQYAHEAEARAIEARRVAMRALAATRGAQHDPYGVLSSRVNASPFGVNVG